MSPTEKLASLRLRLKGFLEPDVKSDFEGYLAPGKYKVLEYRENFPDADTDYALLVAPALGAGDTWICARWKQERYADVEDSAAPSPPTSRSFEDEPMATPEAALIGLLASFHDFTYDRDEARYPFALPGVNVPQSPPNSNNCCTFVEALLVRGWADVHGGDFAWNAERHRQMMINSNDDFFSPVTAAVESGMAAVVHDPDAAPHPWTLLQAWRFQWRGGHTFIIVDHHPATDRVLTLESNSAYRLDGVGFRMIGNLRDQANGDPPPSWWNNEALWTWDRVRTTYRFRQQAWLKVTGRSWGAT